MMVVSLLLEKLQGKGKFFFLGQSIYGSILVYMYIWINVSQLYFSGDDMIMYRLKIYCDLARE